ncbi:MAG: hypothetical protein ACP5OS_06050 [Leptospirillia bacterium]
MKTGRKGVWLAAVMATGMMMAGCTDYSKNYGLNSPGVEVLPLHRDEYRILGDTEGHACGQFVLGARWPWFSAPAKTVNYAESAFGTMMQSIPIIGWFFGEDPAVEEALYNAIDRIPGADSVMSVRTSYDKKINYFYVYKDECVTVKGKAFMLKTDGPGEGPQAGGGTSSSDSGK